MTEINEISISPQKIIKRNLDIMKDSDMEYDRIGDPLKTRKNIKSRNNQKNLQKVIDNFPFDENLPSQCSFWMHALVGKHFFPDGNHRTAILTLRGILKANNIEPWEIKEKEITNVVKKSKKARRNLSINMGNIYQKDRLFNVWKEYLDKYYK